MFVQTQPITYMKDIYVHVIYFVFKCYISDCG